MVWVSTGFHHTAQHIMQFKTSVYFWNFPYNIFRLQLTVGNNMGSKSAYIYIYTYIYIYIYIILEGKKDKTNKRKKKSDQIIIM